MQQLNLSPEQERPSQVDNDALNSARNGANWFYWIAGLSLVNSLISVFGGQWNFIVGLGITQVVDAIVSHGGEATGITAPKIIGLIVDLVIAAIFVVCGFFSNNLQIWAFVIGIVLYLLDGLLMLVIGDFLSAGFHAFVLFWVFRGLFAARSVKFAMRHQN